MEITVLILVMAAMFLAVGAPIWVLILSYREKRQLLDRLMAKNFPEYRQFADDLVPIMKEQRKMAKEMEKKKPKRVTEEDEFVQKVQDEF